MSLQTMIKKCPKCGKKYEYDPTHRKGIFGCPHCRGRGKVKRKGLQSELIVKLNRVEE